MLYECRFPETDNMNWQNGPKIISCYEKVDLQKKYAHLFQFFFSSKGDGTPDKKSCQNDWWVIDQFA